MPFLPFLDSFDHYDSAHSSQKWGTPLTIINSVGRRGTQATQVGGGASLNLSPSTYGSLYVGGAWKNPGNMPFRVSSLVSGAMVGMQFVNDGRFVMAGTDPTALFQAFTGSQTTPP